MANRINKHKSYLNLLQSGENIQQKALLKTASPEQTRILSEIVLNLLNGAIPISTKFREELYPYKDKLRKLSDKTLTTSVLKTSWSKFPLEILQKIIKATFSAIEEEK